MSYAEYRGAENVPMTNATAFYTAASLMQKSYVSLVNVRSVYLQNLRSLYDQDYKTKI